MKNIAIIGAGLSGLVAAQQLGSVAHVTIFEKSKGVGGRIATRRSGLYSFDHGAQFFTPKTELFKEFLKPMI
ncbi:MAG: NAD(P)-binding protein, partial [Proteobacteria bacterium]|nr:NAD(P)-binding protein [Pseudomonadota bacterium]